MGRASRIRLSSELWTPEPMARPGPTHEVQSTALGFLRQPCCRRRRRRLKVHHGTWPISPAKPEAPSWAAVQNQATAHPGAGGDEENVRSRGPRAYFTSA